jgi:hypothetical protein
MWGALGGDVLISENIRINSRLQLERRDNDAWTDEQTRFMSLIVQMEISF